MERRTNRDTRRADVVEESGRGSTRSLLVSTLGWMIGLGVLITGLTSVAHAQDVPFPKLQKDRVYLLRSGLNVPAYETLENQVLELEKGTPQSYYTVILDTAGPGKYSLRDYADSLFQLWSREPGFDAARSVVIAVALGETPPKVAMHPGKELQALGLRPSVIQRDLIEQPGTIDLARKKRFPDAIASLIRSTQSWVAEAETGRSRSQNAEREFSAQVRKGASEAIATADHLLAGGAGGAFNLGTGDGATVKEIADAVARVTGRPLPRKVGPRRDGDPPTLVASNAKAKAVLGWTPTQSSIDEIVETAFRWRLKDGQRG